MPELEPIPERLLRRATELFAGKGFDATSVQDIVDAAELTKGAFYYYFSSKDDLLYRIHERVVSYESEHAERIVARGMPPLETLRALIIDGVESIGLFREEVTVTLREMHRLQPDYYAKITEIRGRYQNYIETIIRQGQDSAVFRKDIPARMATLALLGMCNWMYTWFRPDGPLSPEEIGEAFAALVLQGLRVNAS
ncbi:MAG: TetR/AcrR family transcriptional regulator [Thermaerobacter sp.]|nr:TetR/AcrR family transcriptional regulator [Thermaerobacter sp.]